jgi:ATP-dependent Zn protease
MKPQPKRNSTLLYLLIFVFAIVLIFWLFRSTPATKTTEIPISQVVTMSEADEINSINVQGQNLNIVGTDGTQYTSYLGSNVSIYQVTGLNLNAPVTVNFQASGIDWLSIILTYGFLILIGVFIFIMFFRARGANNQLMNF